MDIKNIEKCCTNFEHWIEKLAAKANQEILVRRESRCKEDADRFVARYGLNDLGKRLVYLEYKARMVGDVLAKEFCIYPDKFNLRVGPRGNVYCFEVRHARDCRDIISACVQRFILETRMETEADKNVIDIG